MTFDTFPAPAFPTHTPRALRNGVTPNPGA